MSILPDTTLCAIVRDEEMNPAGGIAAFVHATLPHVEAGVIVDTGSADDTREILEDLKHQYPHLKVFYRPFDDYASSRNHALALVQTDYAFVLDADELIADENKSIQGGYQQLRAFIKEHPHPRYSCSFKDVQKNTITNGLSTNPRLFHVRGTTYVNYLGRHGERLHNGYNAIQRDHCLQTPVTIYHFRTGAHHKKWTDWYDQLQNNQALQPSSVPSFNEWKAFNPKRILFS